jgi:hypothetical protein
MSAMLAAVSAGCISIDLGGESISGNGDRVTREKALDGELKGVRTSSLINVILDPELDGRFILEGDSNILDIVKVEQSGGMLELITDITSLGNQVGCFSITIVPDSRRTEYNKS